ncbi:MAG: phospho-N-acetylmuramoyl-pentapeptide-transferase [Tissierellia bacterium]|nr:phospho-N-acetylmuramoyl-pentapeptide-transferase [Tissierellia bacterium]
MNFWDFGLPLLVSFGISLLLGRFIIPFLRQVKAGQSIREEGPQSHLAKAGTPTIGGVIFLLASLISLLIFRKLNLESLSLMGAALAFGCIGFIDDYIKVVNKRNLGFTSKQKLVAQILVSLLLIVLLSKQGRLSQNLFIPILKESVYVGWFLIPFAVFVMVGTVNAVNLTDGLDGLSTSVTLVVLGFFALVAYRLDRYFVVFFALVLMGALGGFLYYNKYPAKVFMGDTGSLALGGAVVALAFSLDLPLILPIAGGIYFIEALSVIVQVAYFKSTGKRIFLMSPLHHHYEQKGYRETQIVALFSFVQLILCLLAYFMIF